MAHPLADSEGHQSYAAADLGTATTLMVCGGMTAPVGLGASNRGCGILSEALQMIPFTFAMLRLIERIRLADRRMAASPVVGLGLWGGALRDGLSVGWMELGEQESRLVDVAEQLVLRKDAVELFGGELVLTSLE